MRVSGKITKIYELKEGVSQSNGSAWACRDILIEWTEEGRFSDGNTFTKEESMIVSLRGDNARSFRLDVGVQVEMIVSFKTHEYKGRQIQNIYSNSIFVV